MKLVFLLNKLTIVSMRGKVKTPFEWFAFVVFIYGILLPENVS